MNIQRLVLGTLKRVPHFILRRMAGPPLVIDGNVLDANIHLLANLSPTREEGDGPPTPVELRATIQENFSVFDAARAAGVSSRDTTIPGPAGDMPVRIYEPRNCPAIAPAILFFHQGGLVVMDLDTDDGFCSVMADECGARVISLDYRMCPENAFPAAFDDAFALWDYVQAEATALGIDPARVALAGDSAGGLLGSVMTLELRDRGGVQPAAQLLAYPWVSTDMDAGGSLQSCAEAFPLDRATMDFFNSMVFPDGVNIDHKWANPLAWESHAKLPPAVIATAGFDPIRDQGNAYAEKLKAAGNQVTHHCFGSLTHSFLIFGNVSKAAQQAARQIARDLAALLGG